MGNPSARSARGRKSATLAATRKVFVVHGHVRRIVKRRTGGRAAVSRKRAAAVAGDGVDVPGSHRLAVKRARAGRNHPDPLIGRIGDQQVARAIHGDPAGTDQDRLGRRAAITKHPRQASARRRGELTGPASHRADR